MIYYGHILDIILWGWILMETSHMSTTKYLIQNTLKLGDSFALDQWYQNKAAWAKKIIQNV